MEKFYLIQTSGSSMLRILLAPSGKIPDFAYLPLGCEFVDISYLIEDFKIADEKEFNLLYPDIPVELTNLCLLRFKNGDGVMQSDYGLYFEAINKNKLTKFYFFRKTNGLVSLSWSYPCKPHRGPVDYTRYDVTDFISDFKIIDDDLFNMVNPHISAGVINILLEKIKSYQNVPLLKGVIATGWQHIRTL